jgi:hypothetical protein
MAIQPPATEYAAPLVHCLQRGIGEADEGVGALDLGTMPAGSIVVGAGIIVVTAFNGTTPIADLGTSGDTDGWGTDLALGTIGNIVWDELATSNDLYSTSDVRVQVVVSATGNDSTAGYGIAYVLFMTKQNRLGRSA